jgi:hypothetical protein
MARLKKKTTENAPPFRAPLQRAIRILGSVRALARETSPTLSHTTIRNFERLTDRPPRPQHVIAVERATQGAVDRMEFYPELLRGPLGLRIGRFLTMYAEHDPEVGQLVIDLAKRGIML